MAVRAPLILDGSNNLIEMTTAQINAVKDRVRYLYGGNPSVTLSRVASGGNLGSYNDTRMQAGASTTDVTNFDTAAETPNVSTVTVSYDDVNESRANTSASSDTNSVAFPIFRNDGNNISSMTLTDVYDTFIYPAIDTITGSAGQPGTYYVHTSTSLTGYSAVSSTAIFSDTRADVSDYTAGGIGETQDQPETITNYYLLAANNIAAPSHSSMLYIRNADANLQLYSQAESDGWLENCVRHAASEIVGSKISYNINGSGTNLGSGMVDTKLDGSGNYQTRYVNTDDYRTQEFPNGTPTTISTYRLRMTQV